MAQSDDLDEMVAWLWNLTNGGKLSWTASKGFDAFWADHGGVHYEIDKTDGLPWLAVDGVMVWRAAELWPFFDLVDERFSPPRPTPKPHEPDVRIPQTVAKALKTLRKK